MIVVAFTVVAGYAFWRAVTDPPGRGALQGQTSPDVRVLEQMTIGRQEMLLLRDRR